MPGREKFSLERDLSMTSPSIKRLETKLNTIERNIDDYITIVENYETSDLINYQNKCIQINMHIGHFINQQNLSKYLCAYKKFIFKLESEHCYMILCLNKHNNNNFKIL